jgi:hypothetical protein
LRDPCLKKNREFGRKEQIVTPVLGFTKRKFPLADSLDPELVVGVAAVNVVEAVVAAFLIDIVPK